MNTSPVVNPFYKPAKVQTTKAEPEPAKTSRYVLLPQAPLNASPVPHLTSLYHFDRADKNGDRNYPGNCGGGLIRDLLLYFRPKSVFDPMTGSGTCAEVCTELKIPCLSKDIRYGFDATNPENFRTLGENTKFDFVWAHPPYWRQKSYTNNSRDLSRTSTLEAFLKEYEAFIQNCVGILTPRGKFAVLMGDYIDSTEGFVSLTYHTKQIAYASGLRSHCIDIIRFGHGASSSRKVYRTSFIPGMHDVCMIFELAG